MNFSSKELETHLDDFVLMKVNPKVIPREYGYFSCVYQFEENSYLWNLALNIFGDVNLDADLVVTYEICFPPEEHGDIYCSHFISIQNGGNAEQVGVSERFGKALAAHAMKQLDAGYDDWVTDDFFDECVTASIMSERGQGISWEC